MERFTKAKKLAVLANGKPFGAIGTYTDPASLLGATVDALHRRDNLWTAEEKGKFSFEVKDVLVDKNGDEVDLDPYHKTT